MSQNYLGGADSLPELLLRPLVETALREDIRSGDITTEALIPPGLQCSAALNLRENGVVCGLEVARLAFAILDPESKVRFHCTEGDSLSAGTNFMELGGSAGAILTAERVALNFLQRMSGIATFTKTLVDAVAGTNATIIDTRKTTPGLRLLEKYAVRCGGGKNHRFALDDMILIKDNHVALCGGVAEAVSRARARVGHSVKIEIECDTLAQVEQAAATGADIVLLDNMSNDELRTAVGIVSGRAMTEASGGVNLGTVAGIAATGVDLISVGSLTHGARSLDIGLDIQFVAVSA